MHPWSLTGRMTAGKQLRKAAVGNKGDRKNMTVKEKLKQEEEKLLESVNDSYRDMMRAQFNCIFEELEERSEKSPEYAARVTAS